MKRTLLAAVLLLLVACAASDDPTKGGFFGGVGGLNSGAYAKRLDDRRTELENQEDQRIANQRALDRAQQEQAAVRAQRQKSEARLASLRSDVAALRRKLATAQRGEKSAKGTLAKLQAEVDQLDNGITLTEADAFAAPEDKARRLEQLRRTKEQLETEVQLALKR